MSEPHDSSPEPAAEHPGEVITPCPSWCYGVQCQEEFLEDRKHQREHAVPGVYLPEKPARRDRQPVAVDIYLTAFTDAHQTGDIWIYLGNSENFDGLTISLETAQRIHRELGRVEQLVAGV